MSKRRRNIGSFLFIIVLCLFFVTKLYRDVLGGTDFQGGIWNICQLLFVVAGYLTFFTQYPIKQNNKAISVINLFITFSFYIFGLSLITNQSWTVYDVFSLLLVPYGSLVLIISYCYGRKNLIDDNKLLSLLIITFFVLAILFHRGMAMSRNLIFEDASLVASVYYILCIVPIVLAIIPGKWKLLPFLVLALVLLVSGKRAGMIAFVLSVLVYWNGGNSKEKKWINFIFLCIIVLVVVYALPYIDSMYELKTIDRINSLEKDGGSGRNVRWLACINAIANSNFVELVFGHGMGAAWRDFEGEIHNDFLSVFYEYGIFAFILYVVFYVKLFWIWLKMRREKYRHEKEFLMTWIYSMTLAMFSFFIIEPTYITASMFCFGMFMADWMQSKNTVQC